MKRLLRSERGTSLLEFAVALPMMLVLLMGLIDVGRYMYYTILATHAARAAVQYGAQNMVTAADSTGMTNAARSDGQNLSNWTVNPSYSCMMALQNYTCPSSTTGVAAGMVYFVTVQVTGTFPALLPYPGIPNNIPVVGSASMRVEQQ